MYCWLSQNIIKLDCGWPSHDHDDLDPATGHLKEMRRQQDHDIQPSDGGILTQSEYLQEILDPILCSKFNLIELKNVWRFQDGLLE